MPSLVTEILRAESKIIAYVRNRPLQEILENDERRIIYRKKQV